MGAADESSQSLLSSSRTWIVAPWIATSGLVAVWAVLGNRYSLWYDEAVSVWLSHMSFGDVVHAFFYDEANSGPFFVALWFWEKVWDGAWWARGLSLAGSISAVWGLWVLVSRRAGPMLAGASTIIFAANPFVLDWTLQARTYTAVMGLLVWALVMADEFVRTCGRKEALLLGLFTGLCTATLLTSVFILGAVFAAILVVRPTRDTVRALTRAGVVSLAVFSPFAWSFARNRGQNSWVPPFSAERFRSETIASMGGLPTAVVYGVALAITIAVAIKVERVRSFLLPLGFAVVGIVGLIMLSYLESPMYVWRYMAATPMLLSIAVLGWTTALGERLRLVALGGVVASCVVVTALWGHHALPPNHDYRWAIGIIESEMQPGDWVAGIGNMAYVSVRENWGDDRGDVELRLLDKSGRLEPDADMEGDAFPVRLWIVGLGFGSEDDSTIRNDLGRLRQDFPVTLREESNDRITLTLVARDS